jgi:hypothetical protein
LKDSNANLKMKTVKGIRIHSLIRNTSGVEGHVGTLGWGLGRAPSGSIIHMNLHKPNNKLVNVWLKHFWCMDEPWEYMNSQTHHGLDLMETTTFFPLIVFSMINHEGYIQMSFCLGTPKLGIPKFPKLKLPTLWRAITSCVDLQLKRGLK